MICLLMNVKRHMNQKKREYEESYAVCRKQTSSWSVCGVCDGPGHYWTQRGYVKCLTNQDFYSSTRMSQPRLSTHQIKLATTNGNDTPREGTLFANKSKSSMSRVADVNPKQLIAHRSTIANKTLQPRRNKPVRHEKRSSRSAWACRRKAARQRTPFWFWSWFWSKKIRSILSHNRHSLPAILVRLGRRQHRSPTSC